ncbi:uncharacterized protein LOC141607482 [Silene latifolia]|uniref:uncharacterized protein LOC141607482 n=1 Tax=Silene latifolia TaxID=37657 RepID=UPI003D782D43
MVHCTYLKSVPWSDYKPSQSSSWAWKRICRVKDILLPGYIQHDWLEKDASYSTSSGYKWLGNEASNVTVYRHIWITDGIPKHQFISWLFVQHRLLTMNRIHRLFQSSETVCVLCGEEDESHDHLFLLCSYSRKCLKQVQEWSKLEIPEMQVLSWWQAQDKNRGTFTSLVVMALVYHIWWARNHCRFQQVVWRPEVVGARIKHEVQARIGRKNKTGKKLIWNSISS